MQISKAEQFDYTVENDCDFLDVSEIRSSDTAQAACILPFLQAGERPDLIIDSGDFAGDGP